MSCYLRHMGWLLEDLDLPNERPVRTQVDLAIREVIGMPADARCPEVWAAVKALSDDDRAGLSAKVGAVLGG